LIRLDRGLHLLQLLILEELHDLARGVGGDALLQRDHAAHASAAGRLDVAGLEVLHRHVATDEPALDDFPDRLHFEVVVGDDRDGILCAAEIDLRTRSLEVVALNDLLASLVQGVVDFLQIDRGRDVERVELSHGYTRPRLARGLGMVAERSGLPLVLVVDDYQDAREMYAESLGACGFNVAEAETGDEAVAKAFELVPDAIVMDLSLPGMDGWTATRTLKMDARTRLIPVVVLTGNAPDAPAAAREAGCDAFLPCLPEDIVATVRRVMDEATVNGHP
jgi:CheY-like chemotaxis protein